MITTYIKQTAILFFILFLMTPGFAIAHKVIIFAWVEDGMIYSESSFGSKREAKNCDIIVVDDKGQVVHTGKTDNQGKYSFKIPENTNSDIVLKLYAGQGHQAHWKISANELRHVPSKNDIIKTMETKAELEQQPSLKKIAAGIGMIFLLAFAIKFFKKKVYKHND